MDEGVPTRSTDRECAKVTACALGRSYIDQANTGTSDAVCKLLSTCGSSEFESKNYSIASDRECSSLTPCDVVGQRQSTTLSNVQATPGTEYVANNATDYSDRACAKLTACNPVDFTALEGAPTKVTKSQLLAGHVNVEGDFEVSIDISPESTQTSTESRTIFRLTSTSEDCCGYGDRIAAFAFGAGSSKITAIVGDLDNGNSQIQSQAALPAGVFTTVTLRVEGAKATL